MHFVIIWPLTQETIISHYGFMQDFELGGIFYQVDIVSYTQSRGSLKPVSTPHSGENR